MFPIVLDDKRAGRVGHTGATVESEADVGAGAVHLTGQARPSQSLIESPIISL
jgi:hypothetical protein